MNDTIQVLNIQIDDMESGNMLRLIQSYFQTDTLNVIDFVTMDTLLMSEEQDELQEALKQCDLVLPGDNEILKAADIEPDMIGKNVESYIVYKKIFKYMDKKKATVFLLADSKEQLQKVSTYLRKNYRELQIVGAGIAQEDISDEFIVNKINAAGADCITAFLPSPKREVFASDNRTWMNAKIWVGMDDNLAVQESSPVKSIRMLMTRLLFHRKVVKDKKKNIDN